MSYVLKISDAASLAMHAMVLLAHDPQRSMSTKEIADFLKVSENHLSKVLQRLARAGLVKSIRGPRGGFILAKPSDKITLLDVFETIEGKLIPSRCLLGSRICGGKNCILSDLLVSVDAQFKTYMSTTRLSELIGVYEKRG